MSLDIKLWFRRLFSPSPATETASGIIHDLSNPLTALCLSIEQLKSQSSILRNAKAKKHINTALRASRKMRLFLTSAKNQIQKRQSKMLFDVSNEIFGAIRLFRSLSKKSKIKIRYRSPRAVFVSGDQTKFFRALSNIIGNAIDSYAFNPNAKNKLIIIRLEVNRKTVCVSVRDFGCGIPKNLQKAIFEPFFTTKQRQRESLGLGLSIVKKIIEEEFDGHVTVKSAPGRGSVFKLCLPRF